MQVHRRDSVALTSGILIAVIGGGFLADSTGIWRLNFVYIWPLSLIAIGIAVLFGRAKRRHVEKVRSSQLVAAEERVRIAQELHDIVAHSVSLMTVQISAARRVFDKQPDSAKKALAAAEDVGRQSLDELRNMLTILRSADRSIEAASLRPMRSANGEPLHSLPRLAELDSLVAGMKDAGLNVRLMTDGEVRELPASVELVGYRVVQEALTNSLRHAKPTKVDVHVEYGSDSLTVQVVDDGLGDGAQAGEGHGLTGMRERVVAVGGQMEAGPLSTSTNGRTGWRVWVRIPSGRAR